MKEIQRILPLLLPVLLAACGNGKSPATDAPAPVAKGKSVHSDSFNISVGRLLDAYYALRDGFADELPDTALTAMADSMMTSADSLYLSELHSDTALQADANIYRESIVSELKGLKGETGLDARRRAFQMVGEQLYTLVGMLRYDRSVIYRQYCPTAFNDQGATWLSNTRFIRNPYIPKQMPVCGEVKDSIDFRPE